MKPQWGLLTGRLAWAEPATGSPTEGRAPHIPRGAPRQLCILGIEGHCPRRTHRQTKRHLS